MNPLTKTMMLIFCLITIPLVVSFSAGNFNPVAQGASPPDGTMVIILKNGREQSFRLADIAKIEFRGGATVTPPPPPATVSTPAPTPKPAATPQGTPASRMQGIWQRDIDSKLDGRLVNIETMAVDFKLTGQDTVTGRYTSGQYGFYTVVVTNSSPGSSIVLRYEDRTSGRNYTAEFTGRWVNANLIEGTYRDSQGGSGEFRFSRQR